MKAARDRRAGEIGDEVHQDGLGGQSRSSPPALEICDLMVRYGQAQVLHGLDLELHDGEIVGVLGTNGAGKSTLLRTISGLHRATAGRIQLRGMDISRKSPRQVLRLGVGHVAEGHRIFRNQTVMSNLQLGAFTRPDSDEDMAARFKRVLDLFPVLRTYARFPAASLSGGEQQMLAIGQALMAAPRILLMDEPSAGLAPIVVRELISHLRELNTTGLTLLIVEQTIPLALELCDRVYLIRNGRNAGPSLRVEDIDQAVLKKAYL